MHHFLSLLFSPSFWSLFLQSLSMPPSHSQIDGLFSLNITVICIYIYEQIHKDIVIYIYIYEQIHKDTNTTCWVSFVIFVSIVSVFDNHLEGSFSERLICFPQWWLVSRSSYLYSSNSMNSCLFQSKYPGTLFSLSGPSSVMFLYAISAGDGIWMHQLK